MAVSHEVVVLNCALAHVAVLNEHIRMLQHVLQTRNSEYEKLAAENRALRHQKNGVVRALARERETHQQMILASRRAMADGEKAIEMLAYFVGPRPSLRNQVEAEDEHGEAAAKPHQTLAVGGDGLDK